MILALKFQSVSDIITNSSSEIFQLKSDLTFDVVKGMIEEEKEKNGRATPNNVYDLPYEEKMKYDCSSGMGGWFQILNWEDVYKQAKENCWHCVSSKRDMYTPEIWALQYDESLEELKSMVWVDIDHSFHATIRYILENFWVTGVDSYGNYWQKDPETDRLIRVITKEMYDALPENCRYEN